MGQPLRIVNSRARGDQILFELDRSITGTDHETFLVAPAGDRWCDVLARQLFERRYVRLIHIFSNVVSITLNGIDTEAAIKETHPIVENLFIHYRPGVLPTPV